DLPALDDDQLRRGRPSTWAQFGEGTGILAGDALLAEALRLALTYPTPAVARELVQATLGMIGGQYLDITGSEPDLAALHRLKTGQLFSASVACALWVAEVPEREQAPWRAFADEVGLLFQIVDDILDEDGYLIERGADGARALADETAERAQARLTEVPADTSVLAGIVAGAIIFDWGPRDNAVYPDKELGRAARRSAKHGAFPLGLRGAGRSATAGKLFAYEQGEPAGQGGAIREVGETKVAVFTVVNS